MVVVENLIVKGKYFFVAKSERVEDLKDILQEYLVKKGYAPEGTRNLFFKDRFFTANYRLFFGKLKMPWRYKWKKAIGLLSQEDIETKIYFEELATKRKEIPFEIKISLSLQKFNGIEGITIEVMSKPVAYYQITQMNKNLYLDKIDYSLIKHENTEFIRELMASIHANCLSEPNLLSSYIQTEMSQKLRSYKFEKIASLLEEGKKKLEIGENAVGDLIGVIEIFLVELITKLNITPAGLHQPEKNISKLKEAGFLNERTEGTIQSSLFNAVYRKLKDIDHKKEDIDYFDLVLYYGITESIIDYLLDKIIKYKIRLPLNTPSQNKNKNNEQKEEKNDEKTKV